MRLPGNEAVTKDTTENAPTPTVDQLANFAKLCTQESENSFREKSRDKKDKTKKPSAW